MADSTVLDLPDGVYEDVQGWSGMVRHPDIMALTAGAFPVKPPSSWFANPGLKTLTPLTIDDNGQVFGHIAAWHTSHIGMAGGVKPPRSKTNYAYYRTGVVKCDDGKLVDVGQITLTGGHAPLNAGVSKAVAHYDDTASAIMDVAAGEDKHGIWVAGALRPDVTDAQLRSIRASSVSGDWRPINGKLELVAVCAVNAPGFPIPRARVASGAPIALVAAGIEPLIEIAMNDRIESHVEEGIQAGLELFRERILRLENVVLADGGPVETKPAIDPDQLRKRVRGGSALAASLRERVRGPHPDEIVADVESLAASLRARVKGDDARPKGPAPEALTARGNWNPLLHPRGADGKFIEVGSWVRWLKQGFGSTRRGQVKEIIPDPNSAGPDGIATKALARVEFPALNGETITHDISFDELEKTAAPKGSVSGKKIAKELVDDAAEVVKDVAVDTLRAIVHPDLPHLPSPHSLPGINEPNLKDRKPNVPFADGDINDGNDTLNKPDPTEDEEATDADEEVVDAVEDIADVEIPDTSEEDANRIVSQREADQIAELGDTVDVPESDGGVVDGLIETPFVPESDEWKKTSEWFEEIQKEDTPISEAIVNELHPDAFLTTTEWADAVRLARARYEGWRSSRLAQDPEADVSLSAYLDWLEDRGMAASLVAGLRAEAQVRGPKSLLARATDYWNKDKRDEAASKGQALPDGSYPIADEEDLRKAIQAYGRASHPEKAKRHIIKRARALGKTEMLPDEWKEAMRAAIVARATEYWTDEKRFEAAEKGHALPDGTYPIDDVQDLKAAIVSFGRASDPHATKRHIIKRANLLGSLGLLPREWVGRGFDPARHMRGPDGKFISHGGAKTASASDAVEQLRGRVHGS